MSQPTLAARTVRRGRPHFWRDLIRSLAISAPTHRKVQP